MGHKTLVWKERYGKEAWCVTFDGPYHELVTYQYLTWQEALYQASVYERTKTI